MNGLLLPLREAKARRTVWPAGGMDFMNWTTTQNSDWPEECRRFAVNRQPFRLEHVFGKKEEDFCADLCIEQNLTQEKRGSFVLFTPAPAVV